MKIWWWCVISKVTQCSLSSHVFLITIYIFGSLRLEMERVELSRDFGQAWVWLSYLKATKKSYYFKRKHERYFCSPFCWIRSDFDLNFSFLYFCFPQKRLKMILKLKFFLWVEVEVFKRTFKKTTTIIISNLFIIS